MDSAIVIPIYTGKSRLSKNNQIFFSQIKKVFSKRKFIVLPKSIEKNTTDKDFQIIWVSNSFFKDKLSYSKLLGTEFFYKSFIEFDYIQIVQPDCWVSEDKLIIFLHKDSITLEPPG